MPQYDSAYLQIYQVVVLHNSNKLDWITSFFLIRNMVCDNNDDTNAYLFICCSEWSTLHNFAEKHAARATASMNYTAVFCINKTRYLTNWRLLFYIAVCIANRSGLKIDPCGTPIHNL